VVGLLAIAEVELQLGHWRQSLANRGTIPLARRRPGG
jgi:hypothetical protein